MEKNLKQKDKDNIKNICSKFLKAWQDEDYESMKDLLQKTWTSKQEDITENTKDLLKSHPVNKYEIQDIRYNNKANDVLDLEIFADAKIKVSDKDISIRLVKEKAPYKPSEDGQWGINPISVLKEL